MRTSGRVVNRILPSIITCLITTGVAPHDRGRTGPGARAGTRLPGSGSGPRLRRLEAVRKVLDIVKAVDVSEVFSSVAELDAHLDAMQKKVAESESGA